MEQRWEQGGRGALTLPPHAALIETSVMCHFVWFARFCQTSRSQSVSEMDPVRIPVFVIFHLLFPQILTFRRLDRINQIYDFYPVSSTWYLMGLLLWSLFSLSELQKLHTLVLWFLMMYLNGHCVQNSLSLYLKTLSKLTFFTVFTTTVLHILCRKIYIKKKYYLKEICKTFLW